MSSRSEPDATEAGYCFAKLRRPKIAARRSSRSVADCRRPARVSMVAVAVWSGGVLSILVEGDIPWMVDVARRQNALVTSSPIQS